jgi:hypothetical protein
MAIRLFFKLILRKKLLKIQTVMLYKIHYYKYQFPIWSSLHTQNKMVHICKNLKTKQVTFPFGNREPKPLIHPTAPTNLHFLLGAILC